VVERVAAGERGRADDSGKSSLLWLVVVVEPSDDEEVTAVLSGRR
jgi:hypothetical protein